MTTATNRRAALGTDHPGYQQVLSLWNRWLKQNELFCMLAAGISTDEQDHDDSYFEEACDKELATLNEIENALHDDMGASVHALAAVLMIEMRNSRGYEDVAGLQCAALGHIRPQLVGAIAEAADRVLAGEEEAAA